MSKSYKFVHAPGHPNGNSAGYAYEHRVIAERVLGRPLPPRVEVHHFNEQKADNRNGNLVICENQAYHKLLHRRADALRATGSVHAVRCGICKKWGHVEIDKMSIITRKHCRGAFQYSYHRSCGAIQALRNKNIRKLRLAEAEGLAL